MSALAYWREITIGILTLFVVLFLNLWKHEVKAFSEFKAKTEALGEQAKLEKERLEKERNDNLEKVRQYEKNLPTVRANAVANYISRMPNAGSCAVSGSSGSLKRNDDPAQKCVLDEGFIQDAADDAYKLEQWQEWARLNRVPVQ